LGVRVGGGAVLLLVVLGAEVQDLRKWKGERGKRE